MFTTSKTFAAGLFVLSTVAAAQAAPIYTQPWDFIHESIPSRVQDCDEQGNAIDEVVWDDWNAQQDRTVRRVKWWGHLTSQQAAEYTNAMYCIRIAKNDPGCLPGEIVYSAVVRPRRQFIGPDCVNDRVFAFIATLPGGFQQYAGEKYWISIAEVESESATDRIDFQWSSRRPVQYCPAVAEDFLGNFTRPLISVCDENVVDMSFCLFGM